MNCSTHSELIKNTQIAGYRYYPLVGKKLPSIKYKFSLSIPFIVKYNPSGRYQTKPHSGLGFSLIELVVTMAVAATLVAIAVPNLRTFVQNGRLNTQTNDLLGDLNLARSEAIKRRLAVGICKSTTGTACVGGGGWRDGRMIFVDQNNNSTWDAGIDTILRFREPLAAAADTLTTTVVGEPIFFGANGTSLNFVPGAAPAAFTFCDGRGPANGKQVSLNFMGQAAISSTPPAGC